MGMDPVTLGLLIPAIASVGGKVGESLLAPKPQRFTSFAGTANDPGKLLSEAGLNLRDVFSKIAPALTSAPDMSDAYVQDLPSMSGDTLPIDIASHARWGGGRKPAAPSSSPSMDLSAILGGAPQRQPPPRPAQGPDVPTDLFPGSSRDSSSLLDGMMAALAPGGATSPDAMQQGPMRLPAPTLNGAPPASGGAPNTRTLGAVKMLLHLAQPSMMAGAAA